MPEEGLFREIHAFLGAQAEQSREDIMIEGGILLALLVKRGLTTKDPEFIIESGDRDRYRLIRYLIDPALAADLATAEAVSGHIVIRPNWPRLAGYFGKSPGEFQELLAKRFRKVLDRNWPTIAYLLSRDGPADPRSPR